MKILVLTSLFSWGSLTGTLQGQISGGSASGMVRDPSGATIPQARVGVKNLATQMVRTLDVNSEGFYTAPNLVPGKYEVTVSAVGFETQVAHLTMTIGAEQELNFTLRIGSTGETVEVTVPASGIGMATSALGAVVNQKTLEELPLNGRSWTDLATLEPGVVPIEAQPTILQRLRPTF